MSNKRFIGVLPLIVGVLFVVGCASNSSDKVAVSSSGNNSTAVSSNTTAVRTNTSTAKPTESSSYKTLDQAIKEAAGRIDEQIAAGTKIAILNINSSSDQFSIYVIDELTANFLDTRKLVVIDRKEIDLIRGELEFQLSGAVSDESMQELGRILGAQTIVSGSLMEIGDTYRIVIRALSVQTATVEVQYRTDIANDNRVRALLASGKSTNNEMVKSTVNQPRQTAQTNTRTVQQDNTPAQVMPDVIIPPGKDLAQQLTWIVNQGGYGTVYDIIVNNDILMRPTIISTIGRNITINIRSANQTSPRTIELTGQGHLFEVEMNIVLKLQDIVLKGHRNNNAALVLIGSGGKMILNSGSKVIGNTNTSNTARGGGIRVDGGVLELNDSAEISGNTVRGGAAPDPHSDQFGAWDGHGGGIYAGNRSTITIQGGLISGNKSDTKGGAYGGGIFVIGGSTVNMTGGTISRNSCTVGFNGARFGGGVIVFDQASTFTKQAASGNNTSGIIYGSTGSNANTATDGGHAIYREFANPKQRNSTLGQYDEISTASNSGWGQ